VSKRRKQGTAARTSAPPKVRDAFVLRPFEGLEDEPDWIALRELVPAATTPLHLSAELIAEYGEREITLSTVLPMAWPALTKPDGRIFIGLQRGIQSGDVNRDIAASIVAALEEKPGVPVPVAVQPGPGPRLADVLRDGRLDITMRDGFDFWLDEEGDAEVSASLERANASVFPSAKLAAAPAAYWCRFPEKAHVRWVLREDEDPALAALSRLSAARELTLGEGTKFAGMFRAHGLLVPVWDLPPETPAESWEEPVRELAQRYAAALAGGTELDAAQRRARQGLLGRQLTLR
jgi:hypothetical protein